MKSNLCLTLLFLVFTQSLYAQKTLDAPFSIKKMKKDLTTFRNIRLEANSGFYQYRSIAEIDSIYQWAFNQVEKSNTYLDFYNIICHVTDFEGSLHNDTETPDKIYKKRIAEKDGYFPYPIKIIEDKPVINFKKGEIPIGSEVISINDMNIKQILPNLYKYYTTDGFNISGKQIGINKRFGLYFRLHYGKHKKFKVEYKEPESSTIKSASIESVGYATCNNNFKARHSAPFDRLSYDLTFKDKIAGKESFSFEFLENDIAKLSINSFLIGWHAKDPKHLKYVQFLDSIFTVLEKKQVKNLIVDVRHNGGGSDPNDLVTFSFLTQKPFVENTEAWVSFNKIPYWKHIITDRLFLYKPFIRIRDNKEIREEFSIIKDNKYYQNDNNSDHMVREPRPNTFQGQIYLMISPRVASAGSLFAALVASNPNAITIGEETQGGYYSHNGHMSLDYLLPKSKLRISFSIVNLKQDVSQKANQPFGRGVMPDHFVRQSFQDFMNNEDTQLKYTINLIKSRKKLAK